LPASLDKVDGWIADGVLAGEELNAADFELADLTQAPDELRGPRSRDRAPAGGSAREASRAPPPGSHRPRLPARVAPRPAHHDCRLDGWAEGIGTSAANTA